jgi:HD-GYP domain-containing protein (c-di-GMP phosphodiesterase class II)
MSKHWGRHDTVYVAWNALKSLHKATLSHSIRTAEVAVKVAAKISNGHHLASHDVEDAALFHDIGKLFVPVHILEKNGTLTLQERENVWPHPIWGEQVLLASADGRVRNLSRYVREHHEQADGSGYPSKLSLDEIDPVSRVINIADRFTALTEDRPYREALSPEHALEILRPGIKDFFGREAGKVTDVLAGFATAKVHRQTHDLLFRGLAFFAPEWALAG